MMNETEAPAPNRSTRSAHFYNYVERYLNLLRKRWWVMPLSILFGFGIQAIWLWTAPPSYPFVGRMITNLKIATTTGTGTAFAEEVSNFLGTQRELMLSARVREGAIKRMRTLKPALAPVPVRLQIRVSSKTTIFDLQAVGPEPEYTQAYLNACMEEYIALKSEMRATTSGTTLAQIIEQLKGLDRDLKQYEEEEMTFKTNHNIVVIREQVTSIANYLVQKNRLLDTYKNEAALLTMLTLEQNLDRQKQRATLPGDPDLPSTATSLLNSDFLKARQELQLKKTELQEWSKILRPRHPRIIALNEEIVRRENLLKIFKEESREQFESQRASLSLQTTNLVREIKELEIRTLDMSTILSQYERLLANKQNVQSLRDDLQRAMQSLGVEKEINPETITTLEHATPAKPARGSTVKALINAAVLGLVGGLLLLFLMDRLDDRPGSFSDLQDLFDEEMLGQIPLEKEGPQSKDGLQLLQADDDRHMFLEAYRNLISSLLYIATQSERPKILAVTSAIPGDGKSVTAANVAITMAESGARVLLIDADLRKGLLHRRFDLEVTPGLSEALNGEADVAQAIVPTSYANLLLLPRGNTSRKPGEMFLRPTTRRLIKNLASQFDYVILDTAPVMAAADVTSLAPYVEGVLFVIRANYTSGRVARAALDLLYQRGVKVLGLVFNGVRSNSHEYYYYRYKDYYGERDSKPATHDHGATRAWR